jgi:hypothetical protein
MDDLQKGPAMAVKLVERNLTLSLPFCKKKVFRIACCPKFHAFSAKSWTWRVLVGLYGSRGRIEQDLVELADLIASRCNRPFLVVQCLAARIIKIEILG